MSEVKKSTEIDLPCWLLNKDLDLIEDSNLLAKNNQTDIIGICSSEKMDILEALAVNDIYARPGDSQLLFIQQRHSILVQLIENQRHEGDTGANNSEEQQKENRQIKEDLNLNSAKLNAIFDSTAMFIWTLDEKVNIRSMNKRFRERMLHWFNREVTINEKFFDEPRDVNEEQWTSFLKGTESCFGGEKQHIEISVWTEKDEQVWIEVFLDPIIHPVNKDVKEISCMAFEITEKIRIRQQISKSLKEKETLLQEVHHRVKNNLQIISSIMNLQSSYVTEDGTRDILTECQNRIKSMSFIHDSLYLNDDLDSIDLNHYIQGLCRNLVHSYSVDPERVKLICEVDEVALSLDQAIPCGLIVNELVSNALKYAFPEDRSGQLQILFKEKEGRMAMMISDDGIGIGADIRLEEIESLGLQLVFTLIEQLDGEVEYSSYQGTKYLITFERLKSREIWPESTYS